MFGLRQRPSYIFIFLDATMSKVLDSGTQAQKKFFYGDMGSAIAPRKQAAFVNDAIRQSPDRVAISKGNKATINSLRALAAMRSDDDMEGGKNSVDLVREIRQISL